MTNTKKRVFKVVLTVFICIVLVVAGVFVYLAIEAERMFYKYANDGDKWVCEKYNITLTCHVKENDTPIPDCHLDAKIDGIDKGIVVNDLLGGHAKEWVWTYKKYYDEENPLVVPDPEFPDDPEKTIKLYAADVAVLYGEYHVKSKDTLEFTVYSDDETGMKIDDDCLYSKLKPNETLIFKRVTE